MGWKKTASKGTKPHPILESICFVKCPLLKVYSALAQTKIFGLGFDKLNLYRSSELVEGDVESDQSSVVDRGE